MPYFISRPVYVAAHQYLHDYGPPDLGANTYGLFREVPVVEAGMQSYRLEVAYWDRGRIIVEYAKETDWAVNYPDGRWKILSNEDFKEQFDSAEEEEDGGNGGDREQVNHSHD